MTEQKTIETLPTEEFERIVEQFIVKAAAWDGALPAETLRPGKSWQNMPRL